MSIEVIGPEKYEFQDHVCLLTALRLRGSSQLQAFIEPQGLEDALFRVSIDGIPIKIDLQVKGSKAEVTRKSIAECLMHFPPRRASGSLLERLLACERRFGLMVASGRCKDDALRFAVPKPFRLRAHASNFLPVKEAKALLAEISRQHKREKSKLECARHAKCLALGKSVNPRQLSNALTRLVVDDQNTEDLVSSECELLLKKGYLIPDDRLHSTLQVLLSIVRAAKYEARKTSEQVDVWPRLKEALEKLAPMSVGPIDYYPRGDEYKWRNELSEKGILLLSGRPRCGKSYSARSVASDFQKMGYEIRECTELSEAERFLLDSSGSHRLCVVDDPLGAIQLQPDAGRALERLQWLIERIQPNRKLIIAQSQDQLFEAMGKYRLSDCDVKDMSWQDLSVSPLAFLPNTWITFAEKYDVPPGVRSVVESSLRATHSDLEIGCLYHLAVNANQLSANPTQEEALQLARQDAAHVGSSLARSNPHMKALLAAIAVGTAPGRPMALDEAAFLLDEGGTHFPWREDGPFFVSLGGGEEENAFPSYVGSQRLSAESQSQIDALERRGFITITTSGIIFKHAFYEAAARSTINAPTTIFAKRITALFERALFSLSLATSTAAIQNAEWIISALKGHTPERQQIISNIEDGLESIFPAVRDECFEFLLRHIEDYSGAAESKLERWVFSAIYIDLEDLRWHKGQAWIPKRRKFFSNYDGHLDEHSMLLEKTRLESAEGSVMPTERIARLASFIHNSPTNASAKLVGRMLGSDQAVIRAAAASAWVALERQYDSDLLDRIFEDRHPKVLLEVLECCILRWSELSSDRQADLIRRLSVAVESKSAAIAVLPRMVVFERVEYSGKNPPWDLFESLMPLVLSALPQDVSFNGPRLYSVMESAARFCKPETVVAMCMSWLHWIDLRIAAGRFEQYELSVTDILVRATRKCPPLRIGLIDRLLSIRPTAALIHVISDVQNSWADLTPTERKALLKLLREPRLDQNWLHAVAITRRQVPPEVQLEILGRENALQAGITELLATTQSNLLNAAIAVQCGRPGWFWDIAHSSEMFAEVVRIIESDSNHAMFETTFWEVVLHDDDGRMMKIIESADDESLPRIFQLLLQQRVDCVGMFFPKSWARLLARADSTLRRTWFSEMRSAAPACIDDLSDITDWLIHEEDQLALIELLNDDYTAELLAIRIQKSEIATEFGLEMLKGALEFRPPRFFGTYDHIKARLKKAGIQTSDLLSLIESGRSHSFDERKKIESRYRRRDTEPADWVEA